MILILHKYLKRVGVVVLCLIIFKIFAAHEAQAVAFEKYLLVFPLYPSDENSRKFLWFGDAFRTVWSQAALQLRTLVFLKDDELTLLQTEYRLKNNTEPEPAQMETIADAKDIALLYGSFQIKGDQIIIQCSVISGRNFDVKTFQVTGSKNQLTSLYNQIIRKAVHLLDLSVSDTELQTMQYLPGTDKWEAFHIFHDVYFSLQSNDAVSTVRQAIPNLDKAIQHDQLFGTAIALRATCQMALMKKTDADQTNQRKLKVIQNELKPIENKLPNDPLLQNATLELALQQNDFNRAKTIGEANLRLHPGNYANYLLLGTVYKKMRMETEAETVLRQGLEHQGTVLQKKPFQRQLGLLLLKRNDQQAEGLINEVLRLEPTNSKLHFLRATALYRLGRFQDTMTEIQKTENIKIWPALQKIKAKTAFNLGESFLNQDRVDQAYGFASIALNLQPDLFGNHLLMSKILRKKGLKTEAFQQLEQASQLANDARPKEHFWLGTEYVALGNKTTGAQHYSTYLKLNPKAPERELLIELIRNLMNNEND